MTVDDRPGAGAAWAAARSGPLHAASFCRHSPDSVASVASFVQEGLSRREAVSICVSAPLAGLLRQALDERWPPAAYIDMAELGRNPGRIIPAMLDFAAAHAGRVRYVSQPFWPGRSAPEAVEAMRHEALLNLAFVQTNAAILCLYDAGEVDPRVVAAAEQTHPTVIRDGRVRASSRYGGPGQIPPSYDRPLAAAPPHARPLSYRHDLRPVRQQVARCAREAGLTDDQTADLMLAASEVAANTLRHTAGRGELRVWHSQGEVVCQLQDSGNITDPLAGRWRHADRPAGQGLWVVNQLCDLVELRTGPDGTIVRLHMCL
jgi:anti-sigma regulatory factor (Ser/Thr protein kinase)